MRLDDQLQLGMANLWRTKLRTVLTTLGVCIGIGVLVSMVSFGTGMQKNITQTFKENDLFTSMQVTSKKIDIEQVMAGNLEGVVESLQEDALPLDEVALRVIQDLPGVELAFPEIRFPVKVRFGEHEIQTTLRALPLGMGRYKPYNNLDYGRFFSTDTASSVIIHPRILRDLKIILASDNETQKLSVEDSLRGVRILSADAILGKPVEIITSVFDFSAIMKNPMRQLQAGTNTPTRENSTHLTIMGIQKEGSAFDGGTRFDPGIVVPVKTVNRIPRLGFSSIWNLLDSSGKSDTYASVTVRVKSITETDSVQAKIERMGFGVFSIADQLKELKTGFIIFDTALGAIGGIALIVAALGIINTMVMSILERTREIGVMKAIGGSENEIKSIFFIEAGFIGLVGGIFGLGLGWVVTRIANGVANYIVAREGIPHVDFFYIPIWLILGALAFAILVSLLAGLYPAIRAARVDPVTALRHD